MTDSNLDCEPKDLLFEAPPIDSAAGEWRVAECMRRVLGCIDCMAPPPRLRPVVCRYSSVCCDARFTKQLLGMLARIAIREPSPRDPAAKPPVPRAVCRSQSLREPTPDLSPEKSLSPTRQYRSQSFPSHDFPKIPRPGITKLGRYMHPLSLSGAPLAHDHSLAALGRTHGSGPDCATALSQKIEGCIRAIIDDPERYHYCPTSVGQAFISVGFYRGLRLLGLTDTYLGVLLQKRLFDEIVSHIVSQVWAPPSALLQRTSSSGEVLGLPCRTPCPRLICNRSSNQVPDCFPTER